MKIDLIAGARPNFIKISPVIDEIKKCYNQKISYRLIHTGQHYDQNMSGQFFEQLNIPSPDINFNAGNGTAAEQTSKIMLEYEKLLMLEKPDICLVFGDVTSTMACAIVAKKKRLILGHVEGGIRSRDLDMPEEINRLITDSISDLFFTTSLSANQNLLNEGVAKEKIIFVGNTMIDTLKKHEKYFKMPGIWKKLNLEKKKYIVMTLHRPSNVDIDYILRDYIKNIVKCSRGIPIVFPAHPRTKHVVNLLELSYSNLFIIDPLGYLEFNFLVKNSKAVITDSGGITEETTVLNIPCITLRDNTERPETVNIGTNELIGTNPNNIKPILDKLFNNNWKKSKIPELWDGKSSKRIIDYLVNKI